MSAGPVVLVGLMGSGKTTLGARLAARLDRPFVDADEEVVERAGRTIAELFAAEGEDAFRSLESAVLCDLLGDGPRVVATGGGVVVRSENRARLRDPGVTVVWLDGSPGFLASRVGPDDGRPLLGGGDARAVLERLARERGAWYAEVADLTVDVDPSGSSGPPGALVDDLVDRVRAHEAARS
ncbi:MAG: shikimate kinase [Acidimicrobiia bacterium]